VWDISPGGFFWASAKACRAKVCSGFAITTCAKQHALEESFEHELGDRSSNAMILKSDRPFHRQAVKLMSRIFLGNSRAHYHSWLPSLSIEGRAVGSPGVVRFRGERICQLLDADSLAARAGERVVIIGSGPSVKGQDLGSLPSYSALLLNGAISLAGGQIAEPLAVVMEDERFVWRHADMIRKHISAGTLCLLSPGVIRALSELDSGWLAGRSVILIDDVRKPYGSPRRKAAELRTLDFATLSPDGAAGFSADPDKGVFQGGSVAISALQFALSTNAREIGFLGVDISNADAPRFYESDGDVAFSGIVGAEARILAHIALARDFAVGKGMDLVNHSQVSALRSIGLDYRPLERAA
jgi:hypothetical protein